MGLSMIIQKMQKMLFVIWMEVRSMVRKLLLLLSLFLGINLDAEVLQGDDQGHHQEGDQDHHHAGLHQDADLEDAPDLLQQEGEEDLLLVVDPGAQLAAAEIPPHLALTVPVKSFAFFHFDSDLLRREFM